MLHAGEAREVAIVRHDVGAVLQCEGREMGVTGQIAGGAGVAQKPAEQADVPRRGLGDDGGGSREPRLDLAGRFVDGHRCREEGWAGSDADEGQQRNPSESHRFGSSE